MGKKLAFLAAVALALGACAQQAPPTDQQSSATPIPRPPAVQPADQPGDEFGLEFEFTDASEDIGVSASTTVTASRRGDLNIYSVRHVSGCGYYPASPRYELVGDTLKLSYVLQTDMDALPASPCTYTSEFRFSHDPGVGKAAFDVRQ